MTLSPFPHFQIYDFVDESVFRTASSSSLVASGKSHEYQTDLEKGKQCYSLDSVDDSVAFIVQKMGSGKFIELLEELYGGVKIYSLLDKKSQSLRSFVHNMKPGGFLGSHVDRAR